MGDHIVLAGSLADDRIAPPARAHRVFGNRNKLHSASSPAQRNPYDDGLCGRYTCRVHRGLSPRRKRGRSGWLGLRHGHVVLGDAAFAHRHSILRRHRYRRGCRTSPEIADRPDRAAPG